MASEKVETGGEGGAQKTRIVFLDFDGVIATNTSYKNAKPSVHGTGPETQDLLVPDLVANVNELCEKGGAQVVISSTWRTLFSFESLCYYLKTAGLKVKVIDVTPDLLGEVEKSTRGLEIKAWAVKHGLAREDLIVLEDEEDVRPYKGRQIQTCFHGPHQGFTKRHLRRALKLWDLE